MKALANGKQWWKVAARAVLITASIMGIGCGGDPRASEAGETAVPVSAHGAAGFSVDAGACSEEGAVASCSEHLGEYGGVLSCYLGERRCVEGRWSSCAAGEVVNLSAAAVRGDRSGFLALAPPGQCLNNPCDPECWTFDETPDAALRPDAGSASVIWPGGSLSDYPGGLVNKAIKEPCQWAEDCQFNRKCQHPVTGAGCLHSKCMAGPPLDAECDPCVEAICEVDPSCCDVTPSGPQIDYSNNCKGHDPCEEGGQLKASCHDCVADICAEDPYCCEGGGHWVTRRVEVCSGHGYWKTCWMEWQQVWEEGSWDSHCVELVEEACGLTCPWGSGTVNGPSEPLGFWSDTCVSMVDTVCGAECGETTPSQCVHDVCSTGAALDAMCHSCARAVCEKDPSCCISGWDAACVARVSHECGQSCPVTMTDPPPEQGLCVPWLPSQQRESCDGVDLTGGVVCNGVVPVCNHGTKTAPAGIRVVHFPGNSPHYPVHQPDQDHPQMRECFTSRPIPPGQCLGLEDCADIDDGNRAIMVNPPDPEGASTTYHVEECLVTDNWTLRSGGVECVEPVCSGGESESVIRRVNLLLVMDKSGSMKGSKWNGAAAAIKGFARSPDSAGLHLALEFFALANKTTGWGSNRRSINGEGCGDSSCDSAPCAIPMVPLGVLLRESGAADPQEQAIVAAVDSVGPDSNTPTHPALKGGLEWAVAGRIANPEDVYAVVLITDGEPYDFLGCEKDKARIARLSYDAYVGYGIKTYTVGMDGADVGFLNMIANAGGTGSAFVITTGGDVENELIDTFQAIARENAQCVFPLENADAIDPYDGSVHFYSSLNGATQALPYLDGPDECGDGWYFDDPASPTAVHLCGNTCEVVQTDDRARIDLGFGCAKPYTTTQRTENYLASCPEGKGAQWGYLTYDATVIEDSRILIEVRTARSEEELESKPFVQLAHIGDGGTDPAVCSLFGPLPKCPIALFPALGGVPGARYDNLQLRITMDPASDEYKAPALNDWEITYSCGYDE